MKAISLHQPWASLVALEEKKWETRSRQIHFRGWLAICASKGKESMIYGRVDPLKERLAAHGIASSFDLPLGVVVALARISECITASEWIRRHCRSAHDYTLKGSKAPIARTHDKEHSFGNFAPGRYAWKLEDVRRLREPLPIRGRQFIWTPTAEEQSEIMRRIQ